MVTDNKAPDATPEEKPKTSWGAKTILALAFSTVGAKLSLLGTVADASVLMKGEKASFGEKLRGAVDGTLVQRMLEDIAKNAAGAKTHWDIVKAGSKTFKYTIISTVVGMTAGAVLGWMRGSRVKSVKDIFFHPIESTKLVLGIGGDKQQEQPEAPAVAKTAAAEPSEPESIRWRDLASQRNTAQAAR